MFNSTRLFLLSLCLLFASCSHTPNELKIAKQIMEQHPDSALHILQKLAPEKYSSDANRALYGILLYQALDKNDMSLQPDSAINFSLSYYLTKNDKTQMANCYFYKGRQHDNERHYNEAIELYLKALDNCDKRNDFLLRAKIYNYMGVICIWQKEYKEARAKFQKTIECYNAIGKTVSAKYRLLDIGKTYFGTKDYKTAYKYYIKALENTTDSTLIGATLKEIGINYLSDNRIDSARYYLQKSLTYPNSKYSLGVTYYKIADIFFNIDELDSANIYASKALNNTTNLYTKRECYRILVNASYIKKDVKRMNQYMTKYQLYVDSIRILESQTKATVIEHQYNSKAESTAVKKNLTVSVLILIIAILFCIILGIYLYKRDRLRKLEINTYRKELNDKQVFVSKSISSKIEDLKSIQAQKRKNTLPDEREKLDKELYNNVLHLNDWLEFSSEMNHAFNNIVTKLQDKYPMLSQKEVSWCCLHLLDIPNTDRVLLLETTTEGLYKLKQRIAQKLALSNTKELDTFLNNMVANKI